MRMSDLIDRQALKNKLKRWDERDPYEFVEIALHAVDDAPTIDAVPVRHGEWKQFDLTCGRSIYYCSVCEQATEVPMCMEKPMYAYCPNCGARMDGGKDDLR